MTTIAEGKAFLRQNYVDGTECPCCGQYVKLYKRTITSSMAVGLIQLYHFNAQKPGEFVHIATYLESLPSMHGIPRLTGDFAKFLYWGLVEAMEGERDDGSKRNGYYRITEKGRLFVTGKLHVFKNVFLYDGAPREWSEETMTIGDALRNKFDYSELMAAV